MTDSEPTTGALGAEIVLGAIFGLHAYRTIREGHWKYLELTGV